MGRRTENTMISGTRRRIVLIGIILAVVSAFLLLRLYGIQIIDGDEYRRITESQYLVEVKGLTSRGRILDRNGRPIAGEIYEYYYFIERKKMGSDGTPGKLLTHIGAEDVTYTSDIYKVYKTTNYDVDVCKTLKEKYGAYVIRLLEGRGEEKVAENLIGSIDEDTGDGASGLELAFDKELKGENTKISLMADSAGNLIKGYGPIIDRGKESVEVWEAYGAAGDGKGNDITTCLDLELQRKCEAVIDGQPLKEGHEAVCIVTDTDTGEIVAMAQKESGEKVNPALERELSIGTMGEFIVFACALEKGFIKDEEELQTLDSEVISGLAAQMGYDAVLEKCYKLGFGQLCLDIFPEEAAGFLPYSEDMNLQKTEQITAAANPIKATPIQMAKAATIIADGGRALDLKLLARQGEDSQCEESEEHRAFDEDAVEKAVKTFQAASKIGEDRMMKVMNLENIFAWESEDDGDDVRNYWCAGELKGRLGEDATAGGAGNSEAADDRYTILVVVRGGIECEAIAENIFLGACS